MVKQSLPGAIIVFVIFWLIWAPLVIVTWAFLLPIKMIRHLITGSFKPEPKEANEIEIVITEAKSAEPKDEILFIHGYPDHGAMWDKQIPAFSEEYRCLVVTMPYFSGKHRITTSWGPSLEEVTKGLASIIEKHSKKKKVTLVIHDWGSLFGFFLAHHRPDLVSRIVTLDIGGHMDDSFTYNLFSKSYQLFFCLCFALGDPVSTLMLAISDKTKNPREASEIKGYMTWPYWQLWFNNIWNSNDDFLKQFRDTNWFYKYDGVRPILYIHGDKKPMSFHSEQWLKALDEGKDCKHVAFDCEHHIMYEKPKETNEEILQWLNVTHNYV